MNVLINNCLSIFIFLAGFIILTLTNVKILFINKIFCLMFYKFESTKKTFIMKNIAKLIKLTLIITTSIMMFSCSDDEVIIPTVDNTVVGIASRTPEFSSLVAALTRAELSVTLPSGEITLFAPTNAAFNTFLTANGFVDASGNPDLNLVPVSLLREILRNHVLTGTNLSSSLTTGYVKTLGKGNASSTNTLSMYINTAAGAISPTGVRINGVSNVTAVDILASNGVIHKVDAIIGLPTVVTHATANSNFSTLAGLLTDQGLVPTLMGTTSSPFTVFAPLNSAFTAPVLSLYTGLTNTQKTDLLKYHVVQPANVLSTAIPTGPITTFQGGTFSITGTVITDATSANTNIVLTDVQCANGIIHAVGGVLRPF
jgi:uncharacterized surface protein with fasciclin (FAS1) repeats